jgi:myo-inositol-1(or 4)-monophosphatase
MSNSTATQPTSPTLEDLQTLARQAGEILRLSFGKQLDVEYKGVIDPVTDADRRSEAFLLREIQGRYPTHRVVTEESGEQSGEDCCLWYIDPLDGTVNYANRVPVFSVSLAYAEGGEMRLGVVYDPLRDECFSAEKGQGAWLNGAAIHVSDVQSLDRSLLATGFPYDIRTNADNNLDHFARFALRAQGLRRLGSAALDLCYVADGKLAGFWELRLSAWDVAAGGLIAAEAGARVTNIHGGADYLSQPQSILAANPTIHEQMLRVLQG